MFQQILSVFFALLCCWCTTVHPQQPPLQEAVHHLVLAQQWSIAFCHSEMRTYPCIKPVVAYFTIHGLWPTREDGTSITCGPGPDLLISDLSSELHTQLHELWPNFIGDDFQFWAYEWSTHGRCSNMNAEEYFQLAVNKWKDIGNVSQLIMAGKDGLKARPKPYKYLDIVNGFRYSKKLRFIPEFKCAYDAVMHQMMLWEVYFKVSLPENRVESYEDSIGYFCGPDVSIYYPLPDGCVSTTISIGNETTATFSNNSSSTFSPIDDEMNGNNSTSTPAPGCVASKGTWTAPGLFFFLLVAAVHILLSGK